MHLMQCDLKLLTTPFRFSHQRVWDLTPRLIRVDALVLHAPLFESFFRRSTTLLGPRSESDKGKKCFVIDLDETLVHSSFKAVEHADFKVGVEIDGIIHRVYVLKRPHVDTFLSTMANLYECVLFTASLAKYADPVADFIDKWNAFRYRLFRESCVYHRGNYVKDLSHLGRPLNQVVILDNSPASYMLHTSHAVQISSWFDDANDRVLLDLIPYFERLATHPSVVEFLKNNAPPTPFAAVGTVGLPAAYLSSGSSIADLDDSKVISGTRRPVVASPLPVPIASGSTVASRITRVNQRSISSKSVPVISNMTIPSIGQSISLPQPNTDPPISFPSPFSLASLAYVSPHHSSITAVNRTIIDASKSRIRNHTTNSHNPSACDMNDTIVTTAPLTLQHP
ncbi:unnamed protein product [Dicrocoelium dendriticum]|nr:unnamed protein product [Dicrocoelium dendriticum]